MTNLPPPPLLQSGSLLVIFRGNFAAILVEISRKRDPPFQPSFSIRESFVIFLFFGERKISLKLAENVRSLKCDQMLE